MRRWKLIGLVSLMIISLPGIIWVQLIWINNALGVRNDLFEGSVFQSLQSTARKIESTRQLEFYRRMMEADSILQSRASEIFQGQGFEMNISEPGIPLKTVPRGSAESFSIVITDDGNEITFSGDYLSYIIQDTIMADRQPKIVVRQPEPELLSRSQEWNLNPGEFQRWILRRTEELRKMGDRMVSEIYNWEQTAATDNRLVYETLQSELGNQGIFTPFEFALIENNQIIDGIFRKGTESDFLASNYTVGLFTDNLIKRNSRLALYFPDQKNYVLGSMSFLLGGSMLFSLIILITFTLSIFFIIRQKKISEMKTDFINNMTHEFKTPIATISLAADTISNPKIINDSERVKHFIGMIKKENIRMNKQVENILQIASLDKREIEFRFESVNIHSIIKRSIETIEIQIEGKNGNIYFYPEAVNPVINGDMEHLTNLFHNLLDNANKYSLTEPEITVRTESGNDELTITVEDKGLGMTKSVQTKIFDRFYRKAGGNVHNVKGFGLGLSYVKAIVDAHQGHIQVFSEAGKGTRFVVYLPYSG